MALKHFNLEQDPKMIGLDNKLMILLDNARTMADIPFKITSGKRDLYSNNAVDGVSDSAHLKGLACDIECENSTERYHIIKGAIVAGFKRIGIGKGHIHLDIDHEKAQNVIFEENHSN